MQFAPKTEKEISELNLWPVGEYDFEILEMATLGAKTYHTEEAISKTNNDMIILVTKIYKDNGQFQIIIDYLLEAIPHKLRHAAEACGLINEYNSGSLKAYDFIGKCGKVKLGISKDKSGQYPDKNGINDYIVGDVNPASGADKVRAVAPKPVVGDLDLDQIPF